MMKPAASELLQEEEPKGQAAERGRKALVSVNVRCNTRTISKFGGIGCG